jgi:hypothetical protein
MSNFRWCWLLLLALFATSVESAAGNKILLHPKSRPLPADLPGPFVKLENGSLLAHDPDEVRFSKDDGRTWTARPLFKQPGKFRCRVGCALLRTRDGVIILAFLNEKEQVLRWDQAKGGPQADCRLPVYVARSLDEGQTWTEPRLLQDGWCGAIRQMIQLRSGRVVLVSQVAVPDPGRHVSFTYVSDDNGQTWQKSNVIDLGKYGGYGDHGGGIEGTVAELKDGRLWMLLRTSRDVFTEVFSDDGGLNWKDNRPSKIAASGSPGTLARLASGRLVLLWNRYLDPIKKTGRREQLSMAFSEDDGRTWSEPLVLGYDPMRPGDKEPQHRLSYPCVFERAPGELWVTTLQGQLRVAVQESDFVRP